LNSIKLEGHIAKQQQKCLNLWVWEECRLISNDTDNLDVENDFQNMRFDQKVSYLIENLGSIPDELAEQGVDVLTQAGEIEYAVVLARNKGMFKKAIGILVGAGDYLWAALMAKNAGLMEESERLYREGLDYYKDMEMYGRAVAAATALKLAPSEIDALFRKGIEVESRSMNMGTSRAMIDSALESLEISLLGRGDEMSKQIMSAMKTERHRMSEQNETKNSEVNEDKTGERDGRTNNGD
jgi:hypothetical protein